MTQFCCYRVWDGTHQKFRRTVLVLAFIDLLFISAVITYTGISLYKVATMDTPTNDPTNSAMSIINNSGEDTGSAETNITKSAPCGIDDDDCVPDNPDHSNFSRAMNGTGRIFPPVTPYFQVVGVRIAKSIQLIIYTCQLVMTFVLIRGLIRTDTMSMRTWLIVTEIITTIVLLVLVLYLFGSFKADTVILIACYLVYQFIMIRTVARFIRRTEIELTQFGSIVEF